MSQHQQQQQQQENNKTVALKSNATIINRVYKYPVINMAVSLGYAQYDKLKSSSVTIGEVMTKAENWASYFWQKVAPIVEKFEEPIQKADKLACDTLDLVERTVAQLSNK